MFHGVFFILFYHFFRFEYKKTKRKGCFSRWPFACTVIARSRRLLLIQIRLYFRAISSISPRQPSTIQYHIYIWPPELTATVKIRYDENFRIKKKKKSSLMILTIKAFISIYLTATTKITKCLFIGDNETRPSELTYELTANLSNDFHGIRRTNAIVKYFYFEWFFGVLNNNI